MLSAALILTTIICLRYEVNTVECRETKSSVAIEVTSH